MRGFATNVNFEAKHIVVWQMKKKKMKKRTEERGE